MKTIVITRPKEDADLLEKRLNACGVRAFIEPMIAIEPVKGSGEALALTLKKRPKAILATSKHALCVFASMSKSHHIPMLVVGKATALYAAKLGFASVASAGSSASMLAAYVRRRHPVKDRLLYLRGEDISTDIAHILAPRFTVDEVILYRARAIRSLSATLRKAIAENRVDGVTFFSRRTADIYVTLVKRYALEDAHRTMSAIAMSEAVAGTLAALPWRKIHIARKATAESMLFSIKENVC